MEVIVIVFLIITAISLFVVSFYKKDEYPEMDRKIENFSISLMKDMNQLNNKVNHLTKEVFDDEQKKAFSENETEEEFEEKKIIEMHRQGYSLEEIVNVVSLSKEEVEAYIAYSNVKGKVVSE